MDALSILALSLQCATTAPAPVVAALALAETQGSVYHVAVNGDRSDHPALDIAVQSVALAMVYDSKARIGLAGVPVDAFTDRSYTDGFSPCINLSVAADELQARHADFGGGEDHWRLAALDFATGEPGVNGKFAARFDVALAEVQALVGVFETQNVAATGSRLEDAREPMPVSSLNATEPAEEAGSQWDVYGRDQSRSLLVFSR